ncbi:MAG: protein-disulfide reductase DsbD [Halioglobus sp.]
MRAYLAALTVLLSIISATALNAQTTLGGGSTSPFAGVVQGPEFLPVEQAYRLAVEIEDATSLRLYWQIADEYYLYQHRLGFALSDDTGPIATTPALPPAIERTDEFFGDVRVFYTDLDVSLAAERAASGKASLKVSSQGCADAGLCYPPRDQYFTLDFANATVTEVAPPARRTTAGSDSRAATEASTASVGTLLYMMLLAFLGGSILNLMPCVFPILSLKVLSFARSSDHDSHLHGWLYSAGVVASFVAVAAVLIGLQQAGNAIGWGFQLQSPGFVVALAYLFIAMGLSLSGVIEFGGGFMNTGSGLANRGGAAGSFFTGVLAVVVASPCTAPFMGTALGFALTQPAYVALSIFAALGAGMAAPLLLLSYSKGARRLMPKPGAWMETLKEVLAFPLYATAIWLLWVAGRQSGVDTMAVALIGALFLALGLWVWGQGPWQRTIAVACLVLAATLGTWRGADSSGATKEMIGTVEFSKQRITELQAQGVPVFVDVTADWCITCIANEQAVLFTDDMKAAFSDFGVVYMIADWTNYDPDIADFIEGHGRSGIPLYLVYPPTVGAEPLILPQILTRSTVVEALELVSEKKRDIAGIY